jgi:HAMP domain-containing protein
MPFMKTIFNFFRRLQWKLTLSYAFVTAGTVIVLAALLIGAAIFAETYNSNTITSSFYWTKTGFQDNVPYLLDDPKALQTWLNRVQSKGFNMADFQSLTIRETLDYANTLLTDAPIFILDLDLNIIAAAPLNDSSILGEPYSNHVPENYRLATIVDAALIGDKNYYAQSTIFPDGSRLVAFPLRKSDNDPVVAIVLYQLKPLSFAAPANLSLYQTFFTATAGLAFLASLPVGAVFGWLASRGLRRRLVNLSAASKAWSMGDFSASPRDQIRRRNRRADPQPEAAWPSNSKPTSTPATN